MSKIMISEIVLPGRIPLQNSRNGDHVADIITETSKELEHVQELTERYSDATHNLLDTPREREAPIIEEINKNTGVHFFVPGADPDILKIIDSNGKVQYQLTLTMNGVLPNAINKTTFLPDGHKISYNTNQTPRDIVVATTAENIQDLAAGKFSVIFESNKQNACRDSQGRMYQYAMWAAEINMGSDGAYMYTTAEPQPFPQGNAMHRSVVYKGKTPMGPFKPVGFLGDDKWGIDFSTYGEYGFWSGWENGKDGCQIIKAGQMYGADKMANKKPSILVPSLHPGDTSKQFNIAVNEGPEAYTGTDGTYKALMWSKGLSWVGVGQDSYSQWVYPFYGQEGDDIINPGCYGNPYPLYEKPAGFGHGKCFAKENVYVGHQFYPAAALYHWSTRWVVSTPISLDAEGLPHGDINMEAFLNYRSKFLPRARR